MLFQKLCSIKSVSDPLLHSGCAHAIEFHLSHEKMKQPKNQSALCFGIALWLQCSYLYLNLGDCY